MSETFRGAAAGEAVKDLLERLTVAFTVVEEPGSLALTVIENHSQKALRFALGQVLAAELDRSAQTGSRYLRVALDDGRSFALAAIGLVFAPDFRSTGPLPECPATASFRDFEKLERHLMHVIDEHHDGHEREALQVLMVLLAFLDGARALGIDVGEEERRLEPLLKRLES